MKAKIAIVTGPSGAGKSDVETTLSKLPAVIRVKSHTTRARRPDESDEHYYFITREEFAAKILEGDFLEFVEIIKTMADGSKISHFYGTAKEDFNRALDREGILLLAVDIQGARSISEMYPEAKVFFLVAPKGELIARPQKRQASEEERQGRINGLDEEIAFQHDPCIDYVIENPDGGFEIALKRIIEHIGA